MTKLEVLRNPKQRKLLFSAGMSWLFDAMEVGMISFIVAALAKEWSLSPGQVGVLTSINSIGMALGALLAGALADRFGRKAILMWTLLIFTIASGLSALATGFAVLCVLRLIAGIGLGGELPVASTLVSESMPTAERGRAVVLLESFWAGGWIVSALIANFVIPEYGWRIAFAVVPFRHSTRCICAVSFRTRRVTSKTRPSGRRRSGRKWLQSGLLRIAGQPSCSGSCGLR